VTFFHAVEADLGFVDSKFSGDRFRDQGPIGQKDGSKFVAAQKIVDFPEIRVQQRFSSGQEKTESLDFFKLPGDLLYHFKREILIPVLPKVAVPAREIAPVGHDKLKISKGGCRCRTGEDFSSNRCLGKFNEVLGQTILDEFLVLFFYNRLLSAAAVKKKPVGILAQFVEFVIPDVVEAGFLEAL